MLVLSRKTGESITVGEGIVITIVAIRSDKVRLGIQAPPDVAVHRTEVVKAIGETQEKEKKKDSKAEA